MWLQEIPREPKRGHSVNVKLRHLKPIFWFIAPALFAKHSEIECISGEYLNHCVFIAEFPLQSNVSCCLLGGLQGCLLVLLLRAGLWSVSFEMELKNFDPDLDTRPNHDSLTSYKLIFSGSGKTKPKLLWPPHFPIFWMYFLLNENSHLLCDASSRPYLIDQMTISLIHDWHDHSY